MGTPDFGVPALTALHGAGCRICLVVTQPDRPKGRGRKLAPPPIKTEALRLGLAVFQPEAVDSPEAVGRIAAAAPDVIVTIAYGQVLPGPLLALPRFGAVNVHASLLPKYRGAAPIHRAVINQEPETGVTTMQMDEGLDTGDILLAASTPISESDTAGSVHDRLAALGAELVLETLDAIAAGTATPVPQDPKKASYAPMLSKKDARIDWTRSSKAIDAFVRGMDPWPGAFTTIDGGRLMIYRVKPAPRTEEKPPGTVIAGFPEELRVSTGDGAVRILELKASSGKRMSAADFLRGNPVPAGKLFE